MLIQHILICSDGHALYDLPLDLIAKCRGEHASTSDMKAYGTSKLMTIMSNTEMVRRLKGSGIDSFICQPGMSSTPVYGKTDKRHVMANVLDAAQKVLGQTEERGAVPLLYAATAPEMSGRSLGHVLCVVWLLQQLVISTCMCNHRIQCQLMSNTRQAFGQDALHLSPERDRATIQQASFLPVYIVS